MEKKCDQARGGAKGGGIVHVDAKEEGTHSRRRWFDGRRTSDAGR